MFRSSIIRQTNKEPTKKGGKWEVLVKERNSEDAKSKDCSIIVPLTDQNQTVEVEGASGIVEIDTSSPQLTGKAVQQQQQLFLPPPPNDSLLLIPMSPTSSVPHTLANTTSESVSLGSRSQSLSSDEDSYTMGGDTPIHHSSLFQRMFVNRALSIQTAADVLPYEPLRFLLCQSSKVMFPVMVLGFYTGFVGILWMPFYLFSFLVGELGVYAGIVGGVFCGGRALIR